MNEKKIIALISILLTFIFIIIVSNFVYILNYNNYTIKDFTRDIYGDLSDAYQNDPEVIKVYELCLNSEIKAVCVYENINFVWSKSLESIRSNHFFSPTEIVENSGLSVCRDIAVFRMAVLKKLKIHSKFVFTLRHVYIQIFEGGKIYELNNEFMIIR